MIAVGDAIGALAPPEVAVSYQMPGYILLNKGRAGAVRITVDPAAGAGAVPDWIVVSAEVVISLDEVVDENWRQSSELIRCSAASSRQPPHQEK